MLANALQKELGHPVKTSLAYNQTHGFFADIAQTFYQLSQQNPDTAPEKIAEALLYGNAPEGMDARVAEAAIRYYQAKAEQAALAQLTLDEEGEILRDIRRATAEADKVLLVPHSQGNLFANRMYTLLTDSGELRPQDLRIHGFASPADRVLGNGSYLTSRHDVVISSLDILRKVLPHNIEIPRTKADLLGHGFKEVYLNPALNGREAATTGLLAAMAAMNTTTHPLYANDPLLSRAPLVLDYYGLENPWELSCAAGRCLGPYLGLPFIHLKGPQGNLRFLQPGGVSTADLTTLLDMSRQFQQRAPVRAHMAFALRCEATADGRAQLQPGTYRVEGDFAYESGVDQFNVPINFINGFALTTQGTRYDYQFGAQTQQRSFDDQIRTTDAEGKPLDYATGHFGLVLGNVVVTRNEITGRYRVEWQPTAELAATEVLP
ncbi:hypothetical protein [Chitiniphilus eburneus]|uniref:hypothetical protein n=1 Tax=Chitiniphilus eburneus TaxID=2571148 RepID=UPI0035D0A19E